VEDNAFLGTGWGFPPSFEKREDGSISVKMVSREEDIRESLCILFSTKVGERLMNPEFGCDLHQMVFEQISVSTITKIKEIIRKAILFFEPRITLEKIKIDDSNSIEGRLLISLEYIIRTTNSRSNVVYPFYFLEGNNI
jgi:phage baseplate assembly protein W